MKSTTHEPSTVPLPQKFIGPVRITGVIDEELMIPFVTLEAPLWASAARGARVTLRSGGIETTIVREQMTRSVTLEADNAGAGVSLVQSLATRFEAMAGVVKSVSRFTEFQDLQSQLVGNLLFLRFVFSTGDASGHNMSTLAAERLLEWIIAEYPRLRYVSVSGNYCTDKKVSAVNGILGRGKYVIAEVVVPRRLCGRYLRTSPEKIVDLHIKKNLVGSCIAGSLCSANAHFANVLLAVYLATGQDAANIVEGSQGIVHTEVRGEDLYFSVTLPNVIVGTVGSGKNLPFARENLARLGCLEKRAIGENARRLAGIVAAATLCAELSLLAALTNPGELMKAHAKFERSH